MATKSIAWTTGTGNILLTYTGQGNGTIQVSSDPNNLGSARSQVISVETLNGAISRNITINQAACPVPVGTVLSYSYTGSVQSVTLPAGTYKLQCWGAQGGTCSDGYTGGKGGYSEGQLTISSPTTLYIFVGGQGGTSSNGGWNCGGGSSGSASYNSSGTYGRSSMACGGGATDIALVTSSMSYSSKRNNRSSASLLSRIIVAGGGAGGAYTYREEETTVTTTVTDASSSSVQYQSGSGNTKCLIANEYLDTDKTYTLTYSGTGLGTEWGASKRRVSIKFMATSGSILDADGQYIIGVASGSTFTVPSGYRYVNIYTESADSSFPSSFYVAITHSETSTSTNTSSDYAYGGVGGGTSGGGTYPGKQNAAGNGGEFGKGANQDTTNYRHCSAAGGGGWYGGGGGKYSDSDIGYVDDSGGGSGFVNTAANASYRPSGYTGIQLDSGYTKAGNQSFPKTSGSGNETGHSGNGYAKITRLS